MPSGKILYVVDTVTKGVRSVAVGTMAAKRYASDPRYKVFLDAAKAFALERALRR